MPPPIDDFAVFAPEGPSCQNWLLKDAFNLFGSYTSPRWAGRFFDKRCTRAMRPRLDPIKRFAKTLRARRELLLHWFVARKTVSSVVAEAMKANAKLAVRRPKGFAATKCSRWRSTRRCDKSSFGAGCAGPCTTCRKYGDFYRVPN